MKVVIPDVLRSYTHQAKEVEADGSTLHDLFDDLDRQFPGLRFRVIDELGELRPNIKVFVNQVLTPGLHVQLREHDEVFIMQALSGG